VVKGASRGAVLLVSALAILPFLPTLGGQFLNWDDGINFVTNPGFRGLGWTQLRWMASTTLLGHWIPLTWLSLGVNYALGGLDPWGYHLGNLLLHSANAALFYVVARRLLSAAWDAAVPEAALTGGAIFAALIFAVHPLRVESVAWITERRDLLSGFFFLLAVWAYIRAVWEAPEPRAGWRALSLVAVAAALLSKASTLMLPAVLLLLDVYPLGRRARGLGTLAREKAVYVTLAAIAAVIALIALRSGWAMTSYGDVGLPGRLALMTYSFTFYPWTWLWPVGLSPMYELPLTVNPFEWRFLIPLAAFPAVTLALIALRRRWPGALAAWVYSALMVLPVSGAAHAGFQMAADRYSYLSGLGFALLAGGTLIPLRRAVASERLRRGLAAALVPAAAGVVLILGAETWRQSRVWQDSETLWRWAVSVDPDCALCHNSLGSALAVGAPSNPIAVADAETHFRRAIELRPERDEPYNNLGGTLALQGRLDESAAAFRVFLSRRPNVGSASASLGNIYLRQGRFGDAIPLLRRSLQLNPRVEGARRDLALALDGQAEASRRQGNVSEAERLRQEAIGLRASTAPATGPVETPGADRARVRP
jgi:tetratricopeptide (TPR) repeat protein